MLHQEHAGDRLDGTGRQDALNTMGGLTPNWTGDDCQDEDSLSPREMEVLALVANGAGNSELSDTLCITLNTVKSHMKNIMRKLRTRDRNQTALVGRIMCGGASSGGSG